MTKLALINPIVSSFGEKDEQHDPPLGLAYLASYLRRYLNFDNTVIIDKEKNLLEAIKREKPDIVGITSMSLEYNKIANMGTEIKETFDIPVLIGGVHISLMPHHLSNFDVGVINEGEQTILELMKIYLKQGCFPLDKLRGVEGIVFNDNGNIRINNKRTLINPLDSIPFPARDLLNMKNYMIPRRNFFSKIGRYAQMITSRGCPYKCSFCSSSKFWQSYRRFSAEYVVSEIELLIEKYKAEGIIIWDDLFIADIDRLEKISEILKERKIDIKFNIWSRANLINKHVCELLKKIGVEATVFGLESGSEKILQKLKGKSVTVKDNKRALKLCKEAGITTIGNLVMGHPEETEEDLRKTLSLVRNPNLDCFLVFQLTPLPKTEIWKYAKSIGLVSDSVNFDYSQLSITGYKPELIMTKNLDRDKFYKWYLFFKEEANKKNIPLKVNTIRIKDVFNFLRYGGIRRIKKNWKIYLKQLKIK